jgi:hypothetical protein
MPRRGRGSEDAIPCGCAHQRRPCRPSRAPARLKSRRTCSRSGRAMAGLLLDAMRTAVTFVMKPSIGSMAILVTVWATGGGRWWWWWWWPAVPGTVPMTFRPSHHDEVLAAGLELLLQVALRVHLRGHHARPPAAEHLHNGVARRQRKQGHLAWPGAAGMSWGGGRRRATVHAAARTEGAAPQPCSAARPVPFRRRGPAPHPGRRGARRGSLGLRPRPPSPPSPPRAPCRPAPHPTRCGACGCACERSPGPCP